MKKKIIIKKKYQNENGEMIESTEEITSDSAQFNKMFDDIAELYHKQMTIDVFKFIDPSNN